MTEIVSEGGARERNTKLDPSEVVSISHVAEQLQKGATLECSLSGDMILSESKERVPQQAFNVLRGLGLIECYESIFFTSDGTPRCSHESGLIAVWGSSSQLQSDSHKDAAGRTFLRDLLQGGETTVPSLTRVSSPEQQRLANQMLLCCCELGDNAGIIRALQIGADPNAVANKTLISKEVEGLSALHIAAWSGPDTLEGIKALLAAGADIKATNTQGSTPLMSACHGCSAYSNYEKDGAGLIDTLIAAGADANEGFSNGKSCAFLCINDYDGVVSRSALAALIGHGANLSAVIRYSPAGLDSSLLSSLVWVDSEAARLAVNAGADVNPPVNPAYAPLTYAISRGEPSLVELLISKGAKTDLIIPEKGALIELAKGQLERMRQDRSVERYERIVQLLSADE